MTFINAKKESAHADHDKTNNGGVTINIPRGAKPSQAVGDKSTEKAEESGGVNKNVIPSNYVGGWQ